MKRPIDVDWDAMGELWREQRPQALLPVGLAGRVRAHTRLMWLTTATEVGLFVGLAVLSGWYLGDTPTVTRVVALALVWILNIGIEAFSVWNRRGNWRADAETTEAYLGLILRRARAKLRVARVVRVAAVLQATAVVGLVWVDSARGGPASAPRILTAAALALFLAIGYGVWSGWYERRAGAELVEAEAARRLIEEVEADM